MPMPEIGPQLLSDIDDIPIGKKPSLRNYILRGVEAEREQCYAAGKADERAEMVKCDGRFPTIHKIDLEDGNGVQEFVTRADAEQWGFVCSASADSGSALDAYFRGELKEVK